MEPINLPALSRSERKRIWEETVRPFTVLTRQGVFEISSFETPISKSLVVDLSFLLDENLEYIQFLRQIKKLPQENDGVILDIGANNGVLSLGLLHNCQFSKAVCIEPEPNNSLALWTNANLSQFPDNVLVYSCAASNKDGSSFLELSPENFGDHRLRYSNSSGAYKEEQRKTFEVTTRSLDSIFETIPKEFSNISLAWIDVQGWEWYVLDGGRNLFSQNIPVVCEIWPYGIYRSGISTEIFCDKVQEYWTGYWRKQDNGFRFFHISSLPSLFQELVEITFTDVIFVKD